MEIILSRVHINNAREDTEDLLLSLYAVCSFENQERFSMLLCALCVYFSMLHIEVSDEVLLVIVSVVFC